MSRHSVCSECVFPAAHHHLFSYLQGRADGHPLQLAKHSVLHRGVDVRGAERVHGLTHGARTRRYPREERGFFKTREALEIYVKKYHGKTPELQQYWHDNRPRLAALVSSWAERVYPKSFSLRFSVLLCWFLPMLLFIRWARQYYLIPW